MKITIPFIKRALKIERSGITVIDRKTNLPLYFDSWISKFRLNGKRTPILEGIYDTIASEFSKIDLLLVRDTYTRDENGKTAHNYEMLSDHPNANALTLRPNILQTKSDLLYTVAYQLHAHKNALVRIIRDGNVDRNIVTALEPLNVDDYLFGQGFEISGSLYLKLKEKKTGKILLLDYADLIHLRLNPNDLFHGDTNEDGDLSHFVKIFDENLNALFNELKEAGSVKGIVEIGSTNMGVGFNAVFAQDGDKRSKQQEIVDRIKATNSGILVLDSGEKWHSLTRKYETMSAEEVSGFMQYLYTFKGINQAVINGTATEAQMEVFFNKTVMPIIERFIEELNYKYLTPTARTQGQRIDYFKNPFEYMATQSLLGNLYLGAMFFSQNEIRHMAFKLPPLPGGDELIDNKNFTKTKNTKSAMPDGGGEEDGEDS